MSPSAAQDATLNTQRALAGIAGLDQSLATAQQAQAEADAQKQLADKADRIVGSPGKTATSPTSWRDAAMALKVLGPADPAKGKGIAGKAKEAADKAEAECKKQKDALKKAADTKDQLAQAVAVLDADAKDLQKKADDLAAERDALAKKRDDLRDAIRAAKARAKKAKLDKAAKEAAAAERYTITSVIVACATLVGLYKTEMARAVEEEAAAAKELEDLQDEAKQAGKDLTRKEGRANLATGPARAAQRALDDANKAKSDLDAVLAKKKQLEDACTAATQANTAAQASKDSVVQKRLTKLAGEGHGPQRHQESDPAERRRKCGERALYKLDPETGTQVQTDGRIHAGNQAATSIPSKDDYVRAEAICRLELHKQVISGAADTRGQTVEPLLKDIFKDPTVDCTGLVDNRLPAARPMVVSSQGEVRAMPLKAPPPPQPVFHPPPAAVYPPNPAPPTPAFNADQRQMVDSAIVDVVRQGGDPATFNGVIAGATFQADYVAAYNNPVNAALLPKQRKAAAMTAALGPAKATTLAPPPPLNPPSPPATRAQMDTGAMDAAITANTVPATFTDPNLTAFSVFHPVDPTKPRGDWTMTTLYPTCD